MPKRRSTAAILAVIDKCLAAHPLSIEAQLRCESEAKTRRLARQRKRNNG